MTFEQDGPPDELAAWDPALFEAPEDPEALPDPPAPATAAVQVEVDEDVRSSLAEASEGSEADAPAPPAPKAKAKAKARRKRSKPAVPPAWLTDVSAIDFAGLAAENLLTKLSAKELKSFL